MLTIKMPSRAVLGASALWIVALLLMVFDTLDAGASAAGRWALFIGLAATSSTIALAVRSARRVVLEVMSWEHWMMNGGKEEDRSDGVVRAIRG